MTTVAPVFLTSPLTVNNDVMNNDVICEDEHWNVLCNPYFDDLGKNDQYYITYNNNKGFQLNSNPRLNNFQYIYIYKMKSRIFLKRQIYNPPILDSGLWTYDCCSFNDYCSTL